MLPSDAKSMYREPLMARVVSLLDESWWYGVVTLYIIVLLPVAVFFEGFHVKLHVPLMFVVQLPMQA